MYRRICAALIACVLLFGGCQKQSTPPPPPLTADTAVYEGEGYRLTYPAVFTLTRETAETVYFTADGYSLAFSLTREANPHGLLPVEELLDAMGIYDGVVAVSDRAFAVEKHIPNMLSGYFLYTFTEKYIYLLEYNYGGTEEEKALAKLFSVECL